MQKGFARLGLGLVLLVGFSLGSWPTYRGNPQRTGVGEGVSNFGSSPPVALAKWVVHYEYNSVYSTPGLLDVDGDGADDIFVGSSSSYPSMTRYKYTGGSIVTVWASPDANGSVKYITPSFWDVNGDGVPDPIAGLGGSSTHGLWAWNGATGSVLWSNSALGTIYRSSVLVLPEDTLGVVGSDTGIVWWVNLATGDTLLGYQTGDTVSSSPALGDVDGDGVDEIVVTSHRALFVFEKDGTLAWQTGAFGSWLTTPALGDLDGDGVPEMVVFDAGTGYLRVFRFGSSTALWTIALEPFSMGRGYFAPSPAVGDLDADGQLEIVVAVNRTIYALRGVDGSLVWAPQSLPAAYSQDTLMGSPILANLDGNAQGHGDDALEIVVTGVNSSSWDGVIYYFQDDGSFVWRYADPDSLRYPVENEAALGDVDGDGLLEIVVVDQSCWGVVLKGADPLYVSEEPGGFWASPVPGGLLVRVPSAGVVSISAYNAAGRRLWVQRVSLGAGQSLIPISHRGLAVLVLEGPWGKRTVKLY